MFRMQRAGLPRPMSVHHEFLSTAYAQAFSCAGRRRANLAAVRIVGSNTMPSSDGGWILTRRRVVTSAEAAMETGCSGDFLAAANVERTNVPDWNSDTICTRCVAITRYRASGPVDSGSNGRGDQCSAGVRWGRF